MGWGGILGAMTQGLGTGIVKNVEQGWKDEETQKLLDWKTAEADKQRAFDSELLDKNTSTSLSLKIIEPVMKFQRRLQSSNFSTLFSWW